MTKLYPRNTAYKSLDLVLSKAFSETKNGASVNQVLDIEEIEIIKEYSIVSSTPSIYLVNLDSSFKPVTDMPVKLRDALQTNILDIFSAQDLTDEDLTLLGLNGADTKDFIYEITESIISKGNLKCFYTVGHLGVGFWVIDTKSDAKSCAQLVHDEISETLKSVNVASLDSFITFKNWKELSKRGLVKTYSPSYVPKDKEVLFFNI
jgi:ribosome-binding ATPase YchF (GTP1/OBG family)